MSIAAVSGGTAFLTTAGVTLTLSGAFTAVVGDYIFVAVALATTSSSVVTMTDVALNTYVLLATITNGSSVRTELWGAPVVNASAINNITVTFSSATLASMAWEQYSGAVSTFIGNTSTNTATDFSVNSSAIMQDGGNWLVAAIGFTSISSTTAGFANGFALRQSIIPSVTSVGVALVDASSGLTGTLSCGLYANTSQSFAEVAAELRTHASPATVNLVALPPTTVWTTSATSGLVFVPPLRDIPSVIGGGNTAY